MTITSIQRWRWVYFALAVVVAFTLRWTDLGERPVHTDEAVNAVIIGDMLAGHTYRYDPQDRHGPAFYFVAAPLCRLFGVHSLAELSASQLRAVAVIVGSATVLVLPLLSDAFGIVTLIFASLFIAVGAPFVFYSRYAIHETLFVLSTLLAIAAAWRYWRDGKTVWAIISGISIGIAQCTKETSIITFGAVGAALIVCLAHPPTRQAIIAARASSLPSLDLRRGLILGFISALLVVAIGYSSFGQNSRGLWDALRAYPGFFSRASGQGHEKPWFTYLAWLIKPTALYRPWAGWLLLGLAGFGFVQCWRTRNVSPLIRFFGLTFVGLLALYSAIPYKTPWLMLNFLMPLIFIAAYGVSSLAGMIPKNRRTWSIVILAAFVATALCSETYRVCFKYPTHQLNPYAYSSTAPDINRLVERLEELAATNPRGKNILIQVVSKDYWPLPWYLRKFPNVGYWNEVPATLPGDAILTSPSENEEIQRRMPKDYQVEFFGLRTDVLILLYSKAPSQDR